MDRSTEAPACGTRTPAPNPADTVTVVLFDKVNLTHAPWGRNREERFVFSHLYETLVTIDCHGEVRPGLAKSWTRASDGWLVELRDDAHFWDESPVTAADIAASFEGAIRDGLAIASVDVVDETHVLVHGANGVPEIVLLAHPMVAIRRDSGTTGPPLGTGSWRIDDAASVAGSIAIEPAYAPGPVVRFVRGTTGKALDMMDAGVDAMITDSHSALEYARDRSGATLTPLMWDRAYVFVSGTRSRQLRQGQPVANLPASVTDQLARDAVRIDARGGSALLLASEKASARRVPCESADDDVMSPTVTSRVACFVGDPTARQLAERIVALAAMDTTSEPQARALVAALPGANPGLRALAVSASEIATSLRRGDDFGFVLSLSWDEDFPFVADRFDGCCWLFSADGRLQREAIIPLVETRAHFVALSDRVGFTDDGTGRVRLLANPRRVSN